MMMKTTSPARTVKDLMLAAGPLHLERRRVRCWDWEPDPQVGVTVAVLSLRVDLALRHHARPQLATASATSRTIVISQRSLSLTVLCYHWRASGRPGPGHRSGERRAGRSPADRPSWSLQENDRHWAGTVELSSHSEYRRRERSNARLMSS